MCDLFKPASKYSCCLFFRYTGSLPKISAFAANQILYRMFYRKTLNSLGRTFKKYLHTQIVLHRVILLCVHEKLCVVLTNRYNFHRICFCLEIKVAQIHSSLSNIELGSKIAFKNEEKKLAQMHTMRHTEYGNGCNKFVSPPKMSLITNSIKGVVHLLDM